MSAVGGRVVRMGDRLTVQAFLDAGLDDWRMLATALHARYTTRDFAKAPSWSTPSARPQRI